MYVCVSVCVYVYGLFSLSLLLLWFWKRTLYPISFGAVVFCLDIFNCYLTTYFRSFSFMMPLFWSHSICTIFDVECTFVHVLLENRPKIAYENGRSGSGVRVGGWLFCIIATNGGQRVLHTIATTML